MKQISVKYQYFKYVIAKTYERCYNFAPETSIKYELYVRKEISQG